MQNNEDPYEGEAPEEIFTSDDEEEEPVPAAVQAPMQQQSADPYAEDSPTEISVADLALRLKNLDSWTGYFYGARRTGKSFFTRWLLYYLTLLGKEYDAVFVFSGTAMNNQFSMVSRKFQWERWDNDAADVLEEVFSRQHDIVQHNSECTEESEMKKVPQILVIWDDVFHGGDGSLNLGKRGEIMTKVYTQGRHYSISCVLLGQDMKMCSRLRKNADVLLSFFPASHIIRKEMRDHHMTIESTTPDSVRAAERFMMKTWDGKHACQVVDLAGSAGQRKLSGFVYKCVAPPDDPPLFGMGHESHWQVDATNM